MFNIIKRTNLFNLTSLTSLDKTIERCISTTPYVLAKRKGIRIQRTRELMARAKQRKAEQKDIKQPWIHPKFRVDKRLTSIVKKRYSDIGKKDLPEDDVFVLDGMKEPSYTIDEAIDLHREVLDKSILNEPDALLYSRIELNLRLKRRTKFISKLDGVFLHPNEYFYKKVNRVVAICRNDEESEMCIKAGAIMAGSRDILKLIKDKELKEVDYDYIICHNDMLLLLAESRKYLGDRFPGTYLQNFGADMSKLVKRFVNGITYKFEQDLTERDYGYVDIHFGRANMSNDQLKENFISFLKEMQKHKPTETEHPLITRVLIKAPPNDEAFKVRYHEYLDLEDPFISELKQHEKDLKDQEEEKRKQAKKKKK